MTISTTTTTTTTERRRGRRAPILLAGGAVGACALGALACGGRPPAKAPAPVPAPAVSAAPAPLHVGPLTDFVPAAGLAWLVVAEPRRIDRDPILSLVAHGLLERERLAAFTQRTGVALMQTDEVLAAGYPFATLYAATTHDTGSAEAAFAARLVMPPVTRRPHPELASFTAVVAGSPYTLVTARDRLVALAVGDPLPARAVLGYARGRLTSAPALTGAALSTLPERRSSPPLRFYAAGPFSGEWLLGGRGLLGAATAVAAAVESTSDFATAHSATGPAAGRGLRVELTLAGDFSGGEGARERFAAFWTDLASSPLGILVGLDEPVVPPAVEVTPDRLSLVVVLAVEPLVAGLRAAVAADVDELLGGAGKPPAAAESPP